MPRLQHHQHEAFARQHAEDRRADQAVQKTAKESNA
jgi:hypothetical protein